MSITTFQIIFDTTVFGTPSFLASEMICSETNGIVQEGDGMGIAGLRMGVTAS
ncbi:MAG: hypothetical protein H0T87_10535 [Gammaproteobacteria bacterium]|nr:hypothetical protein [Gammaproteobacteria bacterium]